MSSTEIYGHHINLPEPNPGGMVTDVIVLARIVHMDGGVGFGQVDVVPVDFC